MKHLKPVTKAKSTVDVTTIITSIAAVLTALAPIVTLLANTKKTQEA